MVKRASVKNSPRNKKYILSMDGGGVRTIASIIFLTKLEAKLKVPLAEKFDFFIGTSAGAISCLGLAINEMPAANLINIWSKENLTKIMTNSSSETSLGIMQINPKYTKAYYKRGLAKMNLKDYSGAIADYNKAIEINPRNANAYNNRGNTKSYL